MKRENVLEGKTRRIKTGCGWLYVTLNFQGGKPFETFVNMGKNGGCASAQVQALGLLSSLCLRNGADIKELIRETKGISCHIPATGVLSCADGFAKLLEELIKNSGEPIPPYSAFSFPEESYSTEWRKIQHDYFTEKTL